MATKRKYNRKRVNTAVPKTKKRRIISGGAGDDICKRNINDLLLMDFGRKASGSFDATKFSSDLKRDVTGFKKSISGNWMAMPGPPPKLDCTIS